jgi:hypothetical protein
MFRTLRRQDKKMDQSLTIDILKKANVGVLSTIGEDGYPYGIALNYIYYNHHIYFHCATKGHKLDNILFSDKVSFTVFDDVEVKGEQLTTFYRSVVVFGRAKVIDDKEEILVALVKKYANMNESIIQKMIHKEIDLTSIVEIDIEHITGKIGEK